MIGGAWVFFVSVTALLRFVISRSPTGCVLSPERLPFNSPTYQFQHAVRSLSVYLKQQAPRTTGNSTAQGLLLLAFGGYFRPYSRMVLDGIQEVVGSTPIRSII